LDPEQFGIYDKAELMKDVGISFNINTISKPRIKTIAPLNTLIIYYQDKLFVERHLLRK
jgi:hypothetical protein